MLDSAVTQIDDEDLDFEAMLDGRHAEIRSLGDLEGQRGTPIPALFSQFYKFIQNPSTVSVETFKRMVDTDDTIGSGVDFLTTCLAARLGRYTHKNEQVTEFVNQALKKIKGGFTNVVKELLGATWAGFAVQEKVWANDAIGFIIKKMVSLPPTTLLFEADRYGELTPDGILQFQRGFNPSNMMGGGLYGFSSNGLARNDPLAKLGDYPFPLRTGSNYSYMSIRIPTQKCVHFAFDAQGKFGSPYGRSLLRRAYKWYVMKDAFLQMLAVALDRKGTPLTVVFADPNVTLLSKEQLASGVSQKGKPAGMRADQAAADAFRNIHNDSTIILPGKKGQIFDLDFVPQASNAADFMAAIDLCNKSLLRALLVPSLIFGNGDGTGSYSLGQEHAKTFDKILDGMLAGLKETLLEQVVRHLLAYNFPASMWADDLGDFGKIDMSVEEMSKEVDVLEKAVNMGAVDMNDLNDLNSIRSKIRMEPRAKIIERPELVAVGEDGMPIDDAEGDPEKKKGAPTEGDAGDDDAED